MHLMFIFNLFINVQYSLIINLNNGDGVYLCVCACSYDYMSSDVCVYGLSINKSLYVCMYIYIYCSS